ncbi:MAG: LytTR family DNA-binding domain-containing protein [Chitinophagaceae bacterium]
MASDTHILVVDDELQSRSLIRQLLARHFPALAVEEAATVSEAVQQIRQQLPALVFLDVQMRGETGFDLLDKTTDLNFGIIFTTAYNEFAIKAFKYSAMDYLMKPLDEAEFKTAVIKSLHRIENQQQTLDSQVKILQQLTATHKVPDKISIPTAEGLLFVAIAAIIYCQAISNYTTFHLLDGQKIVSSFTLGYYAELLEGQNFFRIHRSYLVNLAHLKMYKRGDGGSVVMDNDEAIEVSRSNKDALLKILKA